MELFGGVEVNPLVINVSSFLFFIKWKPKGTRWCLGLEFLQRAKYHRQFMFYDEEDWSLRFRFT